LYVYVFVYLLFICHVCVVLYFYVVTSLYHYTIVNYGLFENKDACLGKI